MKKNARQSALALSRGNVSGPSRRRAKMSARPNGDVYEYQPEKNRRSNIPLALDEDEIMGTYGDGEDDPDSFEAQLRNRPRLVGMEDDDALGTDEDEEIDSDEAFGTSDEERYADFNFERYKKKVHMHVAHELNSTKSCLGCLKIQDSGKEKSEDTEFR